MVQGRTSTMRAQRDPEFHGKRLALRFAAVQMGGAVLAAIIVAVITGGSNAMATVAGGAVVAVGNLVFGWRLFAPGARGLRRRQRRRTDAEDLAGGVDGHGADAGGAEVEAEDEAVHAVLLRGR